MQQALEAQLSQARGEAATLAGRLSDVEAAAQSAAAAAAAREADLDSQLGNAQRGEHKILCVVQGVCSVL